MDGHLRMSIKFRFFQVSPQFKKDEPLSKNQLMTEKEPEKTKAFKARSPFAPLRRFGMSGKESRETV